MEAGPDTVYYDTGDVLVTGRRAAYKSVSVPLAGVKSARVERQTMLRSARRWKPSTGDFVPLVVWLAFLVVLVSFAIPLMLAAAAAPLGVLVRVVLAFLAVAGLSVAVAPHRRVVLESVPVWAVLLATDRREVELFRTRRRRKAVQAAEAVNRAVADAGRSPRAEG